MRFAMLLLLLLGVGFVQSFIKRVRKINVSTIRLIDKLEHIETIIFQLNLGTRTPPQMHALTQLDST